MNYKKFKTGDFDPNQEFKDAYTYKKPATQRDFS